MVGIFLDYVQRRISAAAIDDDVFKVRISLQQNGTDCFLDKLALVVTGRDDGDARPGEASDRVGAKIAVHRKYPDRSKRLAFFVRQITSILS
jgi:hypothetical protein